MTLRPALAAAAVLALAACSPPSAQPPQAKPGPAAPAPAEPALMLSPLSEADLTANPLGGELGCSFATADSQAPLLVAMGVVASSEPARGLIKVAGQITPVSAPGGFDAISRGSVFTGDGLTLTVALTGPAETGGESPPRPATLTAERADGARLVTAGRWQCGP